MKNTYTILFMSSNQDSVRQFSIQRGFALCLGLVLCLVFFWIIHFAVSGVKHGIRYRAELQGEVASREELEKTIEQYEKKWQGIQKDLQDFNKMNKTVREYLGIDRGMGILGQGGGSVNIREVNDNELTNSVAETRSAPTSIHADFTDDLLVNQIIQAKHEIIPIYDYVKHRFKELRETPSILPVLVSTEDDSSSYWFSSGFGYRSDPLTEKLRFHNGLDIAANRGTPVIATADGIIEQIGKDPFFGNMVQITHESTQMQTLYGHLKNHADGLQVGKQIKRYDIIGYVGNSGRSTGTHLHYGVYADGKWQNPRIYILDHSPQ